MKHFITILSIFALVLSAFPVLASHGREESALKRERQLNIPADAEQVSENVYRLRPAFDRESRETVEGYAIVHYTKREGEARRQAFSHRGGSAKPRQTQCYGFLATGAKWKTIEPWVVNPGNTYGFSDDFVLGTLSQSIGQWEDAADGTVGNNSSINILGNGSVTANLLSADEIQPDNVNEVYFGPLDQGTIGVTIVWGIFSGPTFQRRLVEWDQVYNTFYSWSGSGELGKMDFYNIAIHELGHSFGMADLYTTSCANETMYGYATEGETKKRDLNTGDILGVSTLY